VPFFPLGSGFGQANPVLSNEYLRSAAKRLDRTPAQIALAWLLNLAPNVLLIPGTSSTAHLEQNVAAAGITLDEHTQAELATATQ
jgi:aryl-alcohol dehydrogenase-like predicted oxidoreductase